MYTNKQSSPQKGLCKQGLQVSCTICIVSSLFYRVHLVQLHFRLSVQFVRCHSYSTVVCISYSKTEMMLYSFTVHFVHLICFTVPFVQLNSCFTVQYVQFSFRFTAVCTVSFLFLLYFVRVLLCGSFYCRLLFKNSNVPQKNKPTTVHEVPVGGVTVKASQRSDAQLPVVRVTSLPHGALCGRVKVHTSAQHNNTTSR